MTKLRSCYNCPALDGQIRYPSCLLGRYVSYNNSRYYSDNCEKRPKSRKEFYEMFDSKYMKNNKNNNIRNELSPSEISNGMTVIDDYGDIGIITECDDPHNVLVMFNNDAKGLYCLVSDCDGKTSNLYRYTEKN